MVEIREASASDLDTLLPWARAFHAMSPYAFLPLYDGPARAHVAGLINAPKATVLMTDSGAIAGVAAYQSRFNTTFLIEDFWYSDRKRDGVKLYRAFCNWGRAHRAEYIMMAAIESRPEVARFYERQGLKPVETHYMGAL